MCDLTMEIRREETKMRNLQTTYRKELALLKQTMTNIEAVMNHQAKDTIDTYRIVSDDLRKKIQLLTTEFEAKISECQSNLEDFRSLNTVCERCCGKGVIAFFECDIDDGECRTCPVCHGTGKKPTPVEAKQNHYLAILNEKVLFNGTATTKDEVMTALKLAYPNLVENGVLNQNIKIIMLTPNQVGEIHGML